MLAFQRISSHPALPGAPFMALEDHLKVSLGLCSLRAPNIWSFLSSSSSLGVCWWLWVGNFAPTPLLFLIIRSPPAPGCAQHPLCLSDILLSPLQVGL